jgi:hypothetical protein
MIYPSLSSKNHQKTLHLLVEKYLNQVWNSFYELNEGYIVQQNHLIRSYSSSNSGNLYFFNLYFLKLINSGGAGGALSITGTGNNQILIEKTLFSHCKTTSDNGGAIFFENYGHLIFHQICGYDCNTGTTTSFGQFCQCSSHPNNTYNISLFSSSIIHSMNNNNGYTVHWIYGINHIIHTNISNNLVQQQSTFSLENHISYTQYCSFENNIAYSFIILSWFREIKQSYLDKSNIINNSQNLPGYGIFRYYQQSVDMIDCLLINNRANSQGPLFYGQEPAIFKIIDCYIDNITGSCTIINTLETISPNFLILFNIDDCLFNYQFNQCSQNLTNLNQSFVLYIRKNKTSHCIRKIKNFFLFIGIFLN